MQRRRGYEKSTYDGSVLRDVSGVHSTNSENQTTDTLHESLITDGKIENIQNEIPDDKETKPEVEFIDDFEKADFEKFNSPASENGLGDTLIYIDGVPIEKIEDSESFCYIIQQSDGNKWFVLISNSSDNIFEELLNENLRLFGSYMGYSDVYNMPAMNVFTEKGYIQRKSSSGKYETVWSFDDFLRKVQNGDTNFDNTDTTNDDQELEKMKLLDSGWCSYKSGDWAHVPYAVQIQNPNRNYAIEFPTITITAKDADGKILSTDEQVLDSIAANDTIFYGNDIFYEGEEPSTVEISVSNSERNIEKQDDDKYVKQSDFVVSNVSENDGRFKTYTGEITNNSDIDFDTVAVIVIYKSGDSIIGGEVEYVDDLMANSTKPFELSSDSDEFEYDSYKFYAIQW